MLLFLFILACLGVGIALVITALEFWIVRSSLSKTFGIVWIMAAVMFTPGLIYRLITNDITFEWSGGTHVTVIIQPSERSGGILLSVD